MKKKILSWMLILSMVFTTGGVTTMAAELSAADVATTADVVAAGQEEEARIFEIKEKEVEPVVSLDASGELTTGGLSMEEVMAQKAHEPKTLTAVGMLDYEFQPDAANIDAALPTSYDSRTKGYITSVKDQNPYGTCWAFAQAAIAEASAKKKGLSTAPDYSEYHLAYFFAHRVTDKLGLTSGDSNDLQQDYLNGGNGYFAMKHLATWSGFATEASVPYSTIPTAPATSKAYTDAVILKKGYFLSDSATDVKNAIINYGAVAASFYWADTYYNYGTAAFCFPYSYYGTNHAITIVGWNDNYSASNFPSASGVTSNGAWIVKNSWSSDWGDDGYFYISYEDASLGGFLAMEVAKASTYSQNYQYDGSCGNYGYNMSSGNKAANIYTVKSDGTHAGQTIKTVQFTTFDTNVKYSIQIYKNLTSSNPTSGTACLSSAQTGTTGSAGIISVDLNSPVYLANGTKFSVVITLSSDSAIAVGYDADYSWIEFTESTAAGQSMYYNGSSWTDMNSLGACFRIKALTTARASKPDKVTNVKATVASSTSNKVSWTKVSDTDGYIIYRKAPGASSYSYYDMVGSSASSYTDTSVTKGSKYSYIVYAYFKNGSSRTLGPASASATVMAGASAVKNLKAVGAGKGKVKLTWTKSTGAPTGYIIYRKVGDGEFEYRYMVGSSTTSFTDTTASETSYNFYRVYPYITVSGKRVLGPSTSYVYAKGEMKAVTNLKAAGVSGGVKLTWTKSTGATGYIIYAKYNGDSKFSYLSMTTGASYTDTKASKSSYNFYRVYPYETISGKRVLGPSTTYVYAKAK